MAEGYCVKCKAKKEIVDAVEETMKNGRKAIKGRCPSCGVVMFKILGGKPARETAPPPAEEPAASSSVIQDSSSPAAAPGDSPAPPSAPEPSN
jgi:uncharacterized Zn finger protein (UPF0148 family)